MEINVTKSFLPPIEDFHNYLRVIWDSNQLSNRGELVVRLENRIKNFVNSEHVTLTTNGTLPIQIAIKALGLKGEIITTPFSYVATTASIVWENCTPVFVDIDPENWTIDEKKIELAITQNTSAILATHVFGNPCEVKAIEQIAKKHNLKVIYDAAHCFGVEYLGKSIFNYGDVSTCSFHATKVFHTGEGGAWFTANSELQKILYYHHNFGHNGQEAFHGLGINAKMSELQAAMGLAVFDHFEAILERRKTAFNKYLYELEKTDLTVMKYREGTQPNYHYFPVLFSSEKQLLKVIHKLNENDIFPRRYFYPSLEELPYIESGSCAIALSISKRIACLPLWDAISEVEICKITKLIKECLS